MSDLSLKLLIYEAMLLCFFIFCAWVSRKNRVGLILVGLFMIIGTTLLLGIFGMHQMIAEATDQKMAAVAKMNFFLPSLFVSFSSGAIGASLVANALTTD